MVDTGCSGDGWLCMGESTYEMSAFEIKGNERITMIENWAAKAGRSIKHSMKEESLYEIGRFSSGRQKSTVTCMNWRNLGLEII